VALRGVARPRSSYVPVLGEAGVAVCVASPGGTAATPSGCSQILLI